MQCSTCKREMMPLFVTQVCDYCDYGPQLATLYRGFILYSPVAQGGADTHEEYVFRTPLDAERWRAVAGRDGCSIGTVYSLSPFQWHMSRGTVRDVVLADHMFEVFSDWRYEPLPNRCFVSELLPATTAPVDYVADDDDIPF